MDWYKITQEAARAVYPLIGCRDKNKIDEAASQAIKKQLRKYYNHEFSVVMGEGEKDKAPGLYRGEKYVSTCGLWDGSQKVEVVCDPVDGTTQTSIGGGNAVSCIALGFGKDIFYTTESHYMKKMLVGPALKKGRYGLNDRISDLVKEFHIYNRRYPNVILLARPRNEQYIEDFRRANANVILIQDCDITACLAVADLSCDSLHRMPDIYYGIGGATETIIISPLAKCFGLQLEAQDWSVEHGLSGPVLKLGDILKGEAVFCATGITPGYYMDGIFRADNISKYTSVEAYDSGLFRKITEIENG